MALHAKPVYLVYIIYISHTYTYVCVCHKQSYACTLNAFECYSMYSYGAKTSLVGADPELWHAISAVKTLSVQTKVKRCENDLKAIHNPRKRSTGRPLATATGRPLLTIKRKGPGISSCIAAITVSGTWDAGHCGNWFITFFCGPQVAMTKHVYLP